MKSREERIEYLRKAVKTANDDDGLKDYYTIKRWRNKPLHLKKLQIDIDFVMFRIENSRTDIQQLAYVRKNGLNTDFFSDPESIAAQTAQEEILFEMVRSKGKGMLDDLRLKGQDDPCIITYDGYLVNGNRRTAALKSLNTRYLECVVLKEDATPKDIYALEQQLQISEDFREPYHWINELRNIKRGLVDERYHFSNVALAENLNLDEKDLKIKLRTLELIDAFLIWKQIPGQYDYPKLFEAEEIFRQLEKADKKYKDNNDKRASLRNGVFILIESKPKEGRLYKYVMDLIKNFDQVYNKVQDEVDTNPNDNSVVGDTDNSLLNDLLGDDKQSFLLFTESNDANELSAQIVDKLLDIAAENKEKQDTEAVYNGVSIALRELQGLVIDNDTIKLDSVKNKLEQIILASERLLKEIQTFKN